MFARRRIRTATTKLATCERSQLRTEESGELATACRETYREVEAARLLLVELGQRHGSAD